MTPEPQPPHFFISRLSQHRRGTGHTRCPVTGMMTPVLQPPWVLSGPWPWPGADPSCPQAGRADFLGRCRRHCWPWVRLESRADLRRKPRGVWSPPLGMSATWPRRCQLRWKGSLKGVGKAQRRGCKEGPVCSQSHLLAQCDLPTVPASPLQTACFDKHIGHFALPVFLSFDVPFRL